MMTVKYSNKFKKDYKNIKKRGLNINDMKKVIEMLANNEKLPEKFKDHDLVGEYKRI